MNRFERDDRVRAAETWLRFVETRPGGGYLFAREDGRGDVVLFDADIEDLIDKGRLRRAPIHRTPTGRISPYDANDEVGPKGADPIATSRQYFLRAWDMAKTPLSDAELKAFVKRAIKAAKREGRVLAEKDGKVWEPSPGTLRRGIHERGIAGDRPIRVMQRMPRRARTRFSPRSEALIGACTEWFYADRPRTVQDAYAYLRRLAGNYDRLGRAAFPATWVDCDIPHYETLRARIRAAENHVRLAAKTSPDEARRRLKGTSESVKADAILQVVEVDSTVADVHVFDSVLGMPLGRPTLTISVDVHSAMILAIVVTWEPPSLHTIRACIAETCRPKGYWKTLYPSLRRDYDGWGKPGVVIADNAWENTGVSLQDAMANLAISLEFAPIHTPQSKALVERTFGTLNSMVNHRLKGGVPFPPDVMRKLGLDPAKDACVEIQDYMEILHVAVVDTYQTDGGASKTAPARRWEDSKKLHGRAFVDDLALLRRSIGAYGEAMLSRSGVRFRGHRFHDQDTVSSLLDDLAGATPMRARRKGSATAHVTLHFDPQDCGWIDVWNDVTKSHVRLPNTCVRFAQGFSFKNAADVRAFALKEQLAFQSDDEKWAARNRLRALIEEAAGPEAKARATRKLRLLRRQSGPIQGDVVETVTARPTANGMGPTDVEHRLALTTRADDGLPDKRPARGRPKAGKRKPGEAEAAPVPTTAPESPEAFEPYPRASVALAGVDLAAVRNLSWVNDEEED